MKNKNYHFVFRTVLASFALLALSGALTVQAASVSGGELILNLDRDAVIAGVLKDTYPDTPTADFPICCRPSLYLEEFFDASAATKNYAQIRDENTPDLYDNVSDEISALGLHLAVNGSVIAANPVGRVNQATTLEFDPADLTGTVSGQVGVGGVLRFRVDVNPPNNRVMLGDMALAYDPSLIDTGTGRSGWVMVNNIGFTINGFHLFDVNTNLTNDSLTLTGVLGLGEGFQHLGGITDTRVGTFSFQTTVVPVPAAVWLFMTGIIGLGSMGYRKRRA